MDKLNVAAYDGWETAASKAASTSMLRAFSPILFLTLGEPVRVEEDAQLIRMVESMHETTGAQHYQSPFAVSLDEADLINEIGDRVCDLTQREFGRAVRPWNAPLAALHMFRLVSAFAKLTGNPSLTVFEIGPGAGYLGALLNRAGHRHISFDITQAMYLWQNLLYGELAGDGLLETADPAVPLVDDPSYSMVHIPWWRILEVSQQRPFTADIVVCQAALNEMDELAMQFNLRLARKVLEGGRIGLFLFDYMGVGRRSGAKVINEFDAVGFIPTYKRLFYGFTLKGMPLEGIGFPSAEVLSTNLFVRLKNRIARNARRNKFGGFLQLDYDVPYHNPSGRDGFPLARDVVPIHAEEEPIDYPLMRESGYFVPEPR